ncbi:hypothetical protein [Streptomyces sp. NPDC002587]
MAGENLRGDGGPDDRVPFLARLEKALRERPDGYALCVSEPVYAGIVRHDHTGIPADEFTAVTTPSKNGPRGAWLYGPPPTGAPAPPTT